MLYYIILYDIILYYIILYYVIVPGRAAILRLQGPKGSLHIMALYFPTGTEIQEDDRRELTPNLLDPSFKALRAAMRRKVANALAPSSLALSI